MEEEYKPVRVRKGALASTLLASALALSGESLPDVQLKPYNSHFPKKSGRDRSKVKASRKQSHKARKK